MMVCIKYEKRYTYRNTTCVFVTCVNLSLRVIGDSMVAGSNPGHRTVQ